MKRATETSAADEARLASPRKASRTSDSDAFVQAAWAMASETARRLPNLSLSLPLRERVVLTPAEERLFEFLLDVEKQYACKAVLRVAGGWVRDKLLGRDSDDIDIVIDTMTGKQFAELINTYEDDHGHKKHAVGLIKANPEQSKHLETVTMQLGDGWVDFVNLRAETYSDEHRIPTVEFGTPQQDAERRDFTINALYYNIATREVEDFTQRGLEDLRRGLIRTPLNPRVTFLDDPLRVLRAVRFSSRFDFPLDEDLRVAAASEEVKEALLKKVSRERVGKELLGMLVGSAAHSERALRTLHELRLCKYVFLLPQDQPVCRPDGTRVENVLDDEVWDRGYAYAAAMHELLEQRGDGISVQENPDGFKLRIIAALLLPFASFYVVIKNRQQSVPFLIVREALKFPNKEAQDIGNVVLQHIAALREQARQNQSACFDRVRVGLLLREIGELWELACDVAMVQDTVDASSPEERQAVVTQYRAFAAAVSAHGLQGVWRLKPLLNGNDAMKVLGVPPGPRVRQLLEQVMIWQLQNPAATRDDCLAHFRAQLALASSS